MSATRSVLLQDASLTLSGSQQTLIAQNMVRSVLIIANPSSSAAWVNLSGGTAAANGEGCVELSPAGNAGDRLLFLTGSIPGNAITVIGTLNAFVTCKYA